MKRLIIMRHGKSSWAETGVSDFDRPLKNRGIKEASLVAEELTKNDIQPDLIISSPANRAKSTAYIVAQRLNYDLDNVQLENSIYGAGLYDILNLIGQFPESVNSVMLFGHNPTFTDVSNHFGLSFFNLPTCGCVGFDFEVNSWANVNGTPVRNSFRLIPSELR